MPGTKAPEAQRREAIIQAAFRVAASGGLQAVTVRSVAREAGVSIGLVLFHFTTMDELHSALLDWLVARVLVVDAGGEMAGRTPGERLLAVVRKQLEETRQQRAEIELFLAYWLLGPQRPDIRATIQSALERYRTALRNEVDAWYTSEPAAFNGTTPEALALLLTTVIEGYALQTVHEREPPDLELVLAVLRSLVHTLV